MQNSIDVFLLTETWFRHNDTRVAARLTSVLTGNQIHHTLRSKQRGGGIALIFKSNIKFSPVTIRTHKTFELLSGNLHTGLCVIKLIVIYRPPRGIFQEFLNEFSSLLKSVLVWNGKLLIAGDFDIHVDNSAVSDSIKFSSFLSSMGLTQHEVGPTHSKGHILDLVITIKEC